MEDLKRILKENYKKYPLSQIRDLIKLIYQNEFAGGHMIKDENESLERLKREYGSLKADPSFEVGQYIGNKLYRVNLQAIKDRDLGKLNQAFVKTANENKGTIEAFEKKIDILRKLIAEGKLGLDADDFEVFIKELKSRNYPPISHSDIYRKAYGPAYRVIRSTYINDFPMVQYK